MHREGSKSGTEYEHHSIYPRSQYFKQSSSLHVNAYLMEVQPIPRESLQSRDFYDMRLPEVTEGILLLNSLSGTTGQVLLMHNHSMEITITELGTIYPYRTFTSPPNNVLMLLGKFPDEGLIEAIGEEMRKAISEDSWVRVLPHFYQGYLHLYLSIATFDIYSPKQSDRLLLTFEFLIAFLSAYISDRMHLKMYSEENKGSLLRNVREVFQISQIVMSDLKGKVYKDCYKGYIAKVKKKAEELVFTLRPVEINGKEFDEMWEWISQSCSSELAFPEFNGNLTLRNLLLTSQNLKSRISSEEKFYHTLVESGFPGLNKDEVFAVKINIAVEGIKKNRFGFTYQIVENMIRSSKAPNQVPLTMLCEALLEEDLQERLIQSPYKILKQYIFTQAEMFPIVLTHLKKESGCKIPLNLMLKCIAKRIAEKDWEFINYVIAHKVLRTKTEPSSVSRRLLKEILIASRKYHMDISILKDLLPPADYGVYMFPVLTHFFTLPRSKQVLFTYFGSEETCREVARTHLHEYQKERIDLWYVFGGSVWIEFLWVWKFVPGLGMRLSGNLVREICAYII